MQRQHNLIPYKRNTFDPPPAQQLSWYYYVKEHQTVVQSLFYCQS